LCRNTALKINFEEETNKQTTLSWIVLVSKSLRNKESIIIKYQIVFLGEKFSEFVLAIPKETHLNISLEKTTPSQSGTKELSWFFRQI